MTVKIINEVYTFVTADDEEEGIIGKTVSVPGIGQTFLPFVFNNPQKIEHLREIAIEIGKVSKKKIKLIRFTNREVLEEL